MPKTRTCTKCKRTKPISRFIRRKNPWKTKTKYFHDWCLNCHAESAVAWRKANPERFKAYQNEYHRKKYHEDIEASRAKGRAKYWKNPEKYRAKQRQRRARKKLAAAAT